MTNLNILIINLLLTSYCNARITGIENLHIQRSSSPFMKKSDNSLSANVVNHFTNIHPNTSPSPHISNFNGINNIKSSSISPFHPSLRTASIDQPSSLFQNTPSLVPSSQPPQIHSGSIQPNPNKNLPLLDQKQDAPQLSPQIQSKPDEPLVGPEDNVESTDHQQPMTDQPQMQQSAGSNEPTNQGTNNDNVNQAQESLQQSEPVTVITQAEIPAKSLITSTSQSPDFEEGPLNDENLRSINLEVTKAEPISSSLVGSNTINPQDQSADNVIPLTQHFNEQSALPNQSINLSQAEAQTPASQNDPSFPQSSTNLSQATEPAARAINEAAAPISPVQPPAPSPIPISPAQAPAPPIVLPAPPIRPQTLPQAQPNTQAQSNAQPQPNAQPQLPVNPSPSQITTPQQQKPQSNLPINQNDKNEAVKANNPANQQPTTVNPPNNANSPPTNIQPSSQQNSMPPNPNQTPSPSSDTPSPTPTNNTDQTPSPTPSPATPESPLPESPSDSQSTTSAPSPSPTSDSASSSNSDSTKNSSNSSTSYTFKSVKPINTLMDSNSIPAAKYSTNILTGALLLTIFYLN